MVIQTLVERKNVERKMSTGKNAERKNVERENVERRNVQKNSSIYPDLFFWDLLRFCNKSSYILK